MSEITVEQLKTLYYVEDFSINELAEHFDVCRRTILNRFEKFDMHRKPDEKNDIGNKSKEGSDIVSNSMSKSLEDKEDIMWQLSDKGKQALSVSKKMQNTKHGFYASIPIHCKAEECPYRHKCYLLDKDLAPYGEPCPIEIANIEELMSLYTAEFEVSPEDITDLSMIKEIVDIDISLLRTNNKLSFDADILQNIVVGVSEDGRPFTKPEVHKAYELQQQLSKRKLNLLKELNATRKAKINSGGQEGQTPSALLQQLTNRLKKHENEEENTIDVSSLEE